MKNIFNNITVLMAIILVGGPLIFAWISGEITSDHIWFMLGGVGLILAVLITEQLSK